MLDAQDEFLSENSGCRNTGSPQGSDVSSIWSKIERGGWAVRLMLLEVAIMPIFDARDYAAQNEWVMPDYARVCDYAGIMLHTNLRTFEVYIQIYTHFHPLRCMCERDDPLVLWSRFAN